MGILEDALNTANAVLDTTGRFVADTSGSAGGAVWNFAGQPIYDRTLGSWGQATEQSYSSPVQLALAQVQAAQQQAAQAYQQQAAAANLSPEYRALYEYSQARPAYEADSTYQRLSPEYQELYAYMQNRQGPAPTAGQQQAAQQQSAQLSRDFEALFDEQREAGDIENWRGTADSLVRVYEAARDSGDTEQMALIQGRLNEFQREVQPHIEILYPGWWDENFDFDAGSSAFERGAGVVGRNALGLASPVLDALNEGWQHVAQSIAVAGVDPEGNESPDGLLDPGMWAGVGRGLRSLFTGQRPGYEDTNFDVDQSGDIGFREAIGADPQAGGTVGDIFDLGAQMALDPLSWVGLGVAGKTNSAMRSTARIAADAGQGLRHKTIFTKIIRQGTKALTPEERELLELWTRKAANDVAAQRYAGLTGKAREAQARLLARGQDHVAKLEDKIAKRAMAQLDRGGQSGLRIAGTTIAPFDNRLTRGLGLMDDVRYEAQTGALVEDGTETVRRQQPRVVFDEQTGTRTRQEPVFETRQVVDETQDPRIGPLRAKAASTPFDGEADAFTRKADELADRLRQSGAFTEEQVQTGVREVTEEFTERIARNEWEWVEQVIPRMRPETFDVIVDTTPGLLRRIVQSDRGFAARIRQRLIPRANINARVDKASSDAFIAAQRQAQGKALRLTDEVNRRLKGRLGQASAKEFGNREAASRYINEALSDPEAFARAMLDTSKPRTRDLLETVNDVREQVWATLTDEQRALFGSKDSYIPRVIADDAMDWVKDLTPGQIQDLRRIAPDLADAIQAMKQGDGTLSEVRNAFDDRFLNQRTISPETQNLFDVNDEIRNIFKQAGINDVGDLYETDVLAAWSVRAESAFKSRIEADMLAGMRGLVDENGQKIIMTPAEYADARTSKFGMRPTQVGDETFYMQADVREAWDEAFTVLRDPQRMDELGNLWTELNGIWARYALLSPGYHSRNAMGNVVLAFLGGLSNPVRYIDAANLQWIRARAYRKMGKTGKSFDEAFAEIKGIEVDQLSKNADYVTIKNLEEQRIMSGLVEDVFLGKDDAAIGEALFDPRKRSKWNITHRSRALGSAIEHNSRVALYLDATSKGMGPQAAAAHVRQYLFDYEDLTRWEQKVRSSVSRFYTFMRKNTALQFLTLAKSPGRIINAERIIDGVLDMGFGEQDAEGENAVLPAWAQAAGLQFRGGNAIGFDSPFYSATNTVESLLAVPTMAYDFASQATGYKLPPLSGDLADAIAYHDMAGRARQAMGLVSGLGPSALEFLYEERLGYDSFTGAPLEMDGSAPFWRMVAVVNPAVSRWESLKRSDQKVEDGTLSGSMMAANWLLGFRVYTGAQADNAAKWTLALELEKIGEEMNLFTREELQDFQRVEATNRFMYTMAYGGMTEDGFDPAKLREELAGYVPQEVLDLYPEFRGIDRRYPTQSLPEDDLQAAQQRLVEAQQALEELLGRPLNDREKVNLILSSDMAPYMEEMEQVGIEPLRDYMDPETNVFTRDAIPEGFSSRPDPIDAFNQLGQALGLEFNDIQALSPLRTEAERLIAQARATGASEEEAKMMAWEYWVAEASRTDLQVLFGEDALSEYGWMGMDDRDLAYEQNRAWQDAAMLRLGNEILGLGLSEEDIMRAIIHMNVGQTDQRALFAQGRLDQVSPYPASRENVQTEEEQIRDALRQLEALRAGVTQGAFLGEYPEEDPRNNWEGWSDGRQSWGN